MLFDLKIYSLKIPDAGLILYPLKIEMLTIPLCGRDTTIFVHKFRIHIVRVGACQNVGSGVVRCASFQLASLVAGDFFVNVCSHCFVFLLFSIAKVVTIFEYPNNFLLFIENLCYCSLKISGISKNSDREKENKNPRPSKNYGCTLFCKNSRPAKNFGTSVGKPSGVVQVFRTSERMQAAPERMQEHTTNARPPQESRRATKGEPERMQAGERQTNKFFVIYIGIEKYLQKKLKKICRYRNLLYLCSRNQKTKQYENNQQQHQTSRALY